jgi:hypothetical protein
VARRHPYVGDDQVRRFFADHCDQGVAVTDGVADLVAGTVQDARQPFAQQH